MKGIPFKQQTRVLGAPKNWDESKHGPCVGLPVHQFEQEGMTVLRSVWEPTPEERAIIAAGGNVNVMIFGGGHPPIYIGACEADGSEVPEPNVDQRGTA